MMKILSHYRERRGSVYDCGRFKPKEGDFLLHWREPDLSDQITKPRLLVQAIETRWWQ
jgi:hypothetical protein